MKGSSLFWQICFPIIVNRIIKKTSVINNYRSTGIKALSTVASMKDESLVALCEAELVTKTFDLAYGDPCRL